MSNTRAENPGNTDLQQQNSSAVSSYPYRVVRSVMVFTVAGAATAVVCAPLDILFEKAIGGKPSASPGVLGLCTAQALAKHFGFIKASSQTWGIKHCLIGNRETLTEAVGGKESALSTTLSCSTISLLDTSLTHFSSLKKQRKITAGVGGQSSQHPELKSTDRLRRAGWVGFSTRVARSNFNMIGLVTVPLIASRYRQQFGGAECSPFSNDYFVGAAALTNSSLTSPVSIVLDRLTRERMLAAPGTKETCAQIVKRIGLKQILRPRVSIVTILSTGVLYYAIPKLLAWSERNVAAMESKCLDKEVSAAPKTTTSVIEEEKGKVSSALPNVEETSQRKEPRFRTASNDDCYAAKNRFFNACLRAPGGVAPQGEKDPSNTSGPEGPKA